MAFNKNTVTPSWAEDPRSKEFVFVGRSGGTPGNPKAGRSTGPHLHFEARDPKTGKTLNPMGSQALQNLYFERPDGQISLIKTKNEKGEWVFDPNAVVTDTYGSRGGKHGGIDIALQPGTRLFYKKGFIAGNIKEKMDPGGYGGFADFKTTAEDALFGHMDHVNTYTHNPGDVASTTAPTPTPATTGETAQKIDGKTIINLAFNLGKKDEDEKDTLANQMLKGYIAKIMQPMDYTKILGSMPNLYGGLDDIG